MGFMSVSEKEMIEIDDLLCICSKIHASLFFLKEQINLINDKKRIMNKFLETLLHLLVKFIVYLLY